jgi:hypothetical protein
VDIDPLSFRNVQGYFLLVSMTGVQVAVRVDRPAGVKVKACNNADFGL